MKVTNAIWQQSHTSKYSSYHRDKNVTATKENKHKLGGVGPVDNRPLTN